jgi:hypothetical protein
MIKWLTGGRPMRRLHFLFVDAVAGTPIYAFKDAFGRLWMAEKPWSLFRVRMP